MSDITTASELDALPEGTTVLDGDHDIMTKGADGQWHLRAENDESAPCHLPAMVLVRPDRPAQPTVQPSERDLIVALHREWDRLPGEDVCECDLIDIAEIGDIDLLTRQAQAVLALIGGRTEAEVKAKALEEAATSLEGGLGVEGTPGTLYEYRAWLRARAAAIRGEQS